MSDSWGEELAGRIAAISAVARTGLAWTDALYERERYERILELAAEAAELLGNSEEPLSGELAQQLKLSWLEQIKPGASGYVTPKLSTGAVCFDPEGRMLLGARGDSGLWFIPTGWCEVGLTPAQNIVKEVQEEFGLDVRPLRLIAVRDTRFIPGTANKPPSQFNPHAIHNIALTFLCETLSFDFKLHPLETRDAGFYTEPEALQLVPERANFVIKQGFAAWRGELSDIYFDQAF